MSGSSSSFSREELHARNTTKYAQNFFRRVPMAKLTYEADAAPLVPAPKKIGKVEVGLADAENVRIKSVRESVAHYSPTERPTIQFRGRLSIAAVEDEVVEESVTDEASPTEVTATVLDIPTTAEADVEADAVDPTVVSETQIPEAKKIVKRAGNQIPIVHKKGRGPLHSYTKAQLAHMEPLENPDGIIGEQRDRIVDRNPRDRTLVVSAPMADTRVISPFFIVVTGIVALVISIGVVGMHSTVTADAHSLAEVYTFTLGGIIDVVREHIAALLVHSFGG